MSVSIWGPAIWNFLHTIVAKIKEDKYGEISQPLFFFIKRICGNLPCPECSLHASSFLGKVVFQRVSTKRDLMKLLCIFHNTVNIKKGKPIFAIENIDAYSKNNLIHAYNRFIAAFNTKGNMKLLADSFQRKIIIQEFRAWFFKNLHNFE